MSTHPRNRPNIRLDREPAAGERRCALDEPEDHHGPLGVTSPKGCVKRFGRHRCIRCVA